MIAAVVNDAVLVIGASGTFVSLIVGSIVGLQQLRLKKRTDERDARAEAVDDALRSLREALSQSNNENDQLRERCRQCEESIREMRADFNRRIDLLVAQLTVLGHRPNPEAYR